MLIKLLGLLDVVAALFLIFEGNIGLSYKVFVFLGMLLILKSSLGMLKDFASWIDFVGGVSLILSVLITVPYTLKIVIGLLLLQKGVFSFIELF
jgi:hypothetical protein